MDTKKATPTKVAKKRAKPKSTPGRSSAKGTPTKSSTAAQGTNDDPEKYFLWLCFMNNGGKSTPDYALIGSKLGIGYKAATNRFYKLRKQFETSGSLASETQKGEKEDTEPIMQAEPDFEADAEIKPEDEDENAGLSDREIDEESAEDI